MSAAKKGRSGFFYARVSVLLCVLAVVIAYAWHDVASRRARKEWDHPLAVAIVLIRPPAPTSTDADVEALRARVPALEARLEDEIHLYRPSAPKPFVFTVFGPVDASGSPPAPAGDGVIDLARHAWDLRRFLSGIDDRAGVATGAYDSRIYVTIEPARSATRKMVEGASEQGGRVGTVSVELGSAGGEDEVSSAAMTDFALSVIAHELLHTLDATDKYDAQGRVRVPDGLAEPDRVPLYPQRFAEIMTRGRPLSATEEKTIDSIDELAVGPATAREIGWLSQEE